MAEKDKVTEIDPLFDGHLEKPVKDMTPDERLDYLWTLIEFSRIIKDRKIIKKKSKKQDSKDG